MNEKIEGLILKQQDYRERDVLLRVFTKEFGKISLIAPGARKLTSKNAGSILPYTKSLLHFDIKEGKTLFRLKTANTISLYRHIHEDLTISAVASILAEVVDSYQFLEDSEEIEEVYQLLDKGWTMLEEKKDEKLVLVLFLSEIMRIFGISPVVDGCVNCGSEIVVTISNEMGGFLCDDCSKKTGISPLPIEELKHFRYFSLASLDDYDVIHNQFSAENKDILRLESFFEMHTGVKIRSFAFYNRLIGIE